MTQQRIEADDREKQHRLTFPLSQLSLHAPAALRTVEHPRSPASSITTARHVTPSACNDTPEQEADPRGARTWMDWEGCVTLTRLR